MFDYHTELVTELNTILPTYYELHITSNTKTPCITYQERNNAIHMLGNAHSYSKLTYTIKVWSNDLEELQRYAKEIDSKLRPLGWNRTSSGELHDINTTIIQKILTYEALVYEAH